MKNKKKLELQSLLIEPLPFLYLYYLAWREPGFSFPFCHRKWVFHILNIQSLLWSHILFLISQFNNSYFCRPLEKMKLIPKKLSRENYWKLLIILKLPKLQYYRVQFSSKLTLQVVSWNLWETVKLKNPDYAAKFREFRSDDVSRFYCQHDILLQNLAYTLPSDLVTDRWKREKTTLSIQFWLWTCTNVFIFSFPVCLLSALFKI